MIARGSARSLLLRDVRGDAELFAGKTDVEDAHLVAQRVSMNAEGARGAAEISRRPLHGADDVLLLELLLREVERNPMRQKFVDDFLELPVQIHDALPHKI